jgi:hypothetical protein
LNLKTACPQYLQTTKYCSSSLKAARKSFHRLLFEKDKRHNIRRKSRKKYNMKKERNKRRHIEDVRLQMV